MKLVVRVLFGGACTSLFLFQLDGGIILLHFYTRSHSPKSACASLWGGGRFSVNDTLDKSLKCRVLNQLFSSSGLVASTTRFSMSVGRLVSRYVGL